MCYNHWALLYLEKARQSFFSQTAEAKNMADFGYIVMLRAWMFRSLIIRTGIKERNIRARNITI